jgi:4-hydroxy-4-methyl-2-oxoglutarate aldolase
MNLVTEKPELRRLRSGHPSQKPASGGQRPNSAEESEWIGEVLYVAAVCDVLDGLGFTHQAMHQRLRPLDPENCTFVGRARTIQWMEANYVLPEDPYGLEIEVIDSLQPGQVVVHSTDYSWTNALWGELMSTVAQRNGVTGCICDGSIRDCRRIQNLRFPVFHAGVRPVDSKGRGRVMACDVPVRCGEVLVNPGELVFADPDGIVAIPLEIEDKVKRLASEKARKENTSREELLAGRTLREVFDKYGVL